MKRQYQHKKSKAAAMRESSDARKMMGTTQKPNSATANRSHVDDAAALPSGLTSGEVDILSGLVTTAISSLTTVRALLERRPLKERQSK